MATTSESSADILMESVTRLGSYGSAGITIIGGLNLSEWGVVFGITLGVATFLMNWRYQHKRLKILERRGY